MTEAPIERVNRVWDQHNGPHGESIPDLIVALAREVQAAVTAERERCAKAAEMWLLAFGARDPKFVSAQKWANDAVQDIADAIRGAH